MNRAIKYRVYPTTEQSVLFAKTFGCCRKVWNLMLSDKIDQYHLTKESLLTTPAQYKKDFPFLKEVDSLALANVQLNLQTAYKNFFRNRKFGFPKFKSKRKARKAYTTNNQNGTIFLTDNGIRLPKAGIVKAVIHRQPHQDWVIKSATVSQSSDGCYYVSVLFEYEAAVSYSSVTDATAIGLDYASDGLYVDDMGNHCDMPHYYRVSAKKLARLQRRLSRKKSSKKDESKSANYLKQSYKVNKLYCHISNQRKDYLHKKSTEIANRYNCVCVESLDMRAMANKGFGNGKATLDNGYGTFLRMLDYKLADRGKYLVKVDKWFPSSQNCSCCGGRYTKIKDLSVRKWTCPYCGVFHDRDQNAAINIKREGLRILRQAA